MNLQDSVVIISLLAQSNTNCPTSTTDLILIIAVILAATFISLVLIIKGSSLMKSGTQPEKTGVEFKGFKINLETTTGGFFILAAAAIVIVVAIYFFQYQSSAC